MRPSRHAVNEIKALRPARESLIFCVAAAICYWGEVVAERSQILAPVRGISFFWLTCAGAAVAGLVFAFTGWAATVNEFTAGRRANEVLDYWIGVSLSVMAAGANLYVGLRCVQFVTTGT